MKYYVIREKPFSFFDAIENCDLRSAFYTSKREAQKEMNRLTQVWNDGFGIEVKLELLQVEVKRLKE